MIAQEASRASPRHDWFIILGAGFLLFADVIFTGSFVITAVVWPFWFLLSIGRAASRCGGWKAVGRSMVIPILTLMIVLGNAYFQSIVASANAGRIIDACERYAAANGTYPHRLDSLVPDYLESIPRATYCLGASRRFSYYSSGETRILIGGVFLRKANVHILEP